MPTSNARLCYENLLENGTVTASSENADYPVENCFDWLTSDYFKPAASGTINIDLTLSGSDSADYFAFYNQNLYSLSGTIKLQWWNSLTSAYVDCFTAVSPTSNAPVVVTFSSQTSTKWRIVITCGSVFSLGCVSFGSQLALEYGMYLNWTPPQFGRTAEIINSVSDGGQFIGRSLISQGVQSSIEIQGASDSWMRTNWPTLAAHLEEKPLFFVPDIQNHSSEAVYCWVSDQLPPPVHSNYGFMRVSIPIRGLIE